jgi:hypothetical protein
MFLKNIGCAALLGTAAFAFALGAASTSDAKGKNETMTSQLDPIICIQSSAPVCGARNGQRFTYNNACFAQKDGAKVVSQGACKAAKKVAKKMDKSDKKADKKSKT